MSKNILNTIAYFVPVYMTTKANYNMVVNCIYSLIKYNKFKYIFINNFDSHKYFINLLRGAPIEPTNFGQAVVLIVK